MVSTSFNQTGEAFVYSSIAEIVNVWARGTGDASFSIDVKNGSATVNMSFSLGPLDKLHVLPSAQCNKKLDGDAKPKKNFKKKSLSRLRRNRKRAEAFKRSKLNLILPFAGELLPLYDYEETVRTNPIVSATIREETSPKVCAPPKAVAPSKLISKQRYLDVGTVRKQLFLPSTSSKQDQLSVLLKIHVWLTSRRKRLCGINCLCETSFRGVAAIVFFIDVFKGWFP